MLLCSYHIACVPQIVWQLESKWLSQTIATEEEMCAWPVWTWRTREAGTGNVKPDLTLFMKMRSGMKEISNIRWGTGKSEQKHEDIKDGNNSVQTLKFSIARDLRLCIKSLILKKKKSLILIVKVLLAMDKVLLSYWTWGPPKFLNMGQLYPFAFQIFKFFLSCAFFLTTIDIFPYC